jgi:hypothetical protein
MGENVAYRHAIVRSGSIMQNGVGLSVSSFCQKLTTFPGSCVSEVVICVVFTCCNVTYQQCLSF